LLANYIKKLNGLHSFFEIFSTSEQIMLAVQSEKDVMNKGFQNLFKIFDNKIQFEFTKLNRLTRFTILSLKATDNIA